MPNDPIMDACQHLVDSGRYEWFTLDNGELGIRVSAYGKAIERQEAAALRARKDG